MITYEYALNNGFPVHINSLKEKDRKDYQCPGCGDILRPSFGKVQSSYFFHHNPSSGCTDKESYLHHLGKLVFQNQYNKALDTNTPFYLERSYPVSCDSCEYGPCNLPDDIKKENLIRTYREIRMEKKDGVFVPDLLLISENNQKIYVEIFVTHKCEPEKINSGIPIIEFQLKTEIDLESLKQDVVTDQNEFVKLYNLDIPPVIREANDQECQNHCPLSKTINREGTKLLKQTYEKSLRNKTPFYLEYKTSAYCNAKCLNYQKPCRLGEDSKKYDVTRHFKKIEREGYYLILNSDSNRKKKYTLILEYQKRVF